MKGRPRKRLMGSVVERSSKVVCEIEWRDLAVDKEAWKGLSKEREAPMPTIDCFICAFLMWGRKSISNY